MESKVLLIEDDKVDQIAFKRLVENEKLSYNYKITGSVLEAKKILHFDIVITDYLLGDGTAFDNFKAIQGAPIIGDEEIAVKAMKAGAYDYLIKDQDRNYLRILPVTVESAIKHRKAEEQFRILSHAIMNISDSVFILVSNH
jgi:DNA-binding NtrC family response regulator